MVKADLIKARNFGEIRRLTAQAALVAAQVPLSA
jgi:hypothetical protein